MFLVEVEVFNSVFTDTDSRIALSFVMFNEHLGMIQRIHFKAESDLSSSLLG